MTKINFKNSKMKTTTTILAALAIGLIMSSPMTLLPNVNAVNPLTIHDVVKQLQPIGLSDESSARDIAISNPEITKLIGNRHYEFMSTAWVGQIYPTYFTAYPEVHINVDNKFQIAVTVDPASKSVRNYITGPIVKLGSFGSTTHAFAGDYYTASSNPNGIEVNYASVPSYTNHNSAMDQFMAFLMNAAEKSATDSLMCTPSDTAADFFSQSGVLYNYTNVYSTYTDTEFGCIAQTSSAMPYTSGHTYTFGEEAVNSHWFIFGTDQNGGPTNYFSYTVKHSINNYSFKYNDYNTGPFMENANTQTGWNGAFGSSTATLNTAKYSTDGGNTWSNWGTGADTAFNYDCSGNSVSSPKVTTGGLSQGGSATWSISTMAGSSYVC